jgi:hypothetical protein
VDQLGDSITGDFPKVFFRAQIKGPTQQDRRSKRALGKIGLELNLR